jgi:hypothetical protein
MRLAGGIAPGLEGEQEPAHLQAVRRRKIEGIRTPRPYIYSSWRSILDRRLTTKSLEMKEFIYWFRSTSSQILGFCAGFPGFRQ